MKRDATRYMYVFVNGLFSHMYERQMMKFGGLVRLLDVNRLFFHCPPQTKHRVAPARVGCFLSFRGWAFFFVAGLSIYALCVPGQVVGGGRA
ncbi:unnamed protein product [Ectocarpus fasciculatus]